MAYKTLINTIDDDSLLQIFNCYRLEDEYNRNPRRTWLRLGHVCQRWRYLLYDSLSHLGVCLLLTNDSPSLDKLGHLPPLPLDINFSYGTNNITRKDQDNIHLGLQQYGVVRQIDVRAPSSSMHTILLELMDKPFSRLGNLSLLSTTAGGMSLVLPEALQAPFLSHLSLHRIGLPRGLSLLSSMFTLSSLSLTDIQESCYFPPGHLVTQLQDLLCLEELLIGFTIPIPLPSSQGELLPAPIPPVTLPALRLLTFRGVDIYIDNLIAQINAPLLEKLRLTLLFDLTFTLVNLTKFIYRTEGFECLVAQVIFNKDGASIGMDLYEQRGKQWGNYKYSLQVYCLPLDWKIDSATQVCGALVNIVSTIEKLTLDLDMDGMPSNWESTLDSTLWYELLLPFTGVKKLHIGSSLAFELSRALESVAGGLVHELLPKLQELDVHLGIDQAKHAFSTFVKNRKSIGRPVELLAIQPQFGAFDKVSFCRYVNDHGRAYRYQAMELISICRTLLVASEQDRPQDIALQKVLQACDTAITRATESRKRVITVDQYIAMATQRLREYISERHPKANLESSVDDRMKAAREMDRRMKSMNLTGNNPLRVVEFRVLRSLPDMNPTIVRMALSDSSDLPEILWYFSHFPDEKRLSLAQNPQFYGILPTSPAAYVGGFSSSPTEFYQGTINVLTNSSRRIFLECDPYPRIFDNVWAINGILIFRDVIGRLEGETIVSQFIQNLPIAWSRMDPPEYRPEVVGHITDWRVPIFEFWSSPNTRILIRA